MIRIDEGFATSKRSVYFDLTDVLEYARQYDTVSGIPRAGLVIAGHIIEKHGRDAARLVAWHPVKASFFELENDWCTSDYEFDRREFSKWFDLDRTQLRTIANWAASWYSGRPFRRRYHWVRAHLMAALRREAFFRKRRIVPPQAIGDKLRPSRMKAGDIIVIMGATWTFDAHMAFLAEQKRKGISVVLFVHDLVPLLMPEHVTDKVPDHFKDWLDRMSDLAAAFITNSQSTKRDLDQQLAFAGLRKPIHAVPLAQQFLFSGRAKSPARRPRARVLSDARLPFVLCVGTIESRKNGWGLARVWTRLADELGLKTPRLVFAGKQGWLKQDFDDLMRGTGNLGGLVRIVEGPTEYELAYLYSKCLFTVFPSFYEGWGLPIGESLWFGKVCVTSKAGAMPEVGMDMCPYIDPNDLDELHAVVRRMIVDPAYRSDFEQRIVRARLRTWADVADGVWSALAGLESDCPVPAKIPNAV